MTKQSIAPLVLSFILPVAVLAAVFAVCGIYPFGVYQIYLNDLWEQYYPFIFDYWRKLRGGDAAFWSWTASNSYLPVFAYYASSPLNLLLVLLPFAALKGAITVLLLLRVGLAGLFMALFLRSLSDENRFFLPAFALAYALCGFGIGYAWHFMWLDTFALLPLVMTGLRAFVNKGAYRLYVAALALSVWCNFLMGFYVCVFAVIMFFCFSAANNHGFKETARKFAGMAGLSLIAVSATLIIVLPAYYGTRNISQDLSVFKGVSFYHPFPYVIGAFAAGNNATFVYTDDIPNYYSTLAAVLLLIPFALSDNIAKREKIFLTAAMVFFVLCLNFSPLDYALNGFRYTRGVPGRYSFLLSFLIVMMGYKGLCAAKKSDYTRMSVYMATLAAALIICAFTGTQTNFAVAFTAGLAVLYIALFRNCAKTDDMIRPRLCAALCVLVIIETGTTLYVSIKSMYLSDGFAQYPAYSDSVDSLLGAGSGKRENDSAFYRTELTYSPYENNGAVYGYDGLAFYASSGDYDVTAFMMGLGLGGTGHELRYKYSETSPFTNALLNIRYVISPDGVIADDTVYLRRVCEDGEAVLLENNYLLPFGFMAGGGITEYMHTPNDPFQSQNDLFRLSTGIDGDLFVVMPPPAALLANYTAIPHDTNPYLFVYEQVEYSEDGSVFEFEYDIPKDGMVYAMFKSSFFSDVGVAKNGDYIRTNLGGAYPYLFPAGRASKGDSFVFTPVWRIDRGFAEIKAAVLDHGLFIEGFELLSQEAMQITEFTNIRIKGVVQTESGGVLYLSLPYDNNWRAYVNGDKAQIVPIGGGMSGIPLDAGAYEIELVYANKAFTAGVFAFFAAALAFIFVLRKYKVN